mmetsp:Transcript_6249/g.20395  ORF Transcript_6249/g.20395 Transcript_6249/m.20395 type:complete len:296 (-) Transcript_6249:966-1853(-)
MTIRLDPSPSFNNEWSAMRRLRAALMFGMDEASDGCAHTSECASRTCTSDRMPFESAPPDTTSMPPLATHTAWRTRSAGPAPRTGDASSQVQVDRSSTRTLDRKAPRLVWPPRTATIRSSTKVDVWFIVMGGTLAPIAAFVGTLRHRSDSRSSTYTWSHSGDESDEPPMRTTLSPCTTSDAPAGDGGTTSVSNEYDTHTRSPCPSAACSPSSAPASTPSSSCARPLTKIFLQFAANIPMRFFHANTKRGSNRTSSVAEPDPSETGTRRSVGFLDVVEAAASNWRLVTKRSGTSSS